MERLLILGMGGHARSVVDSIRQMNQYEVVGFVDKEASNDYDVIQMQYLGTDNDLQELFDAGIRYAVIGIGYLGRSTTRNILSDKLNKIGYSLPTIIDPSAMIAEDVMIGEGTFIGKGAIINTNVHVGKMCIINSGAVIEHDCEVGDFSHISVGSIMCGGVIVGKSTFVGANSTIIQEIKIGNECIVGAGTVVTKNVESGVVLKHSN